MTAKMTDKELFNEFKNIFADSGAYNTNKRIFYEGVKFGERFYLPQIQQLQGEYQTIKKMLESANDTNWEYRKEIEQLTAKHEKLVKGLKEIPIYDKKEMDWAVDGTKWILKYSIDNLLTESEDK